MARPSPITEGKGEEIEENKQRNHELFAPTCREADTFISQHLRHINVYSLRTRILMGEVS
jgi:hypothetical protein